jgi:L-arabinonolactonase
MRYAAASMTETKSAGDGGEIRAELLVDCHNALGECVMYNSDDRRVYWTDVYERRLYDCATDGSDVSVRELPEKLGSFAFDAAGNLLAAFESGLFRYELSTGRAERLTRFEPDIDATRLNDGRCDRDGRFVVGGCHQGFYNPVSSVLSYDGASARTLIEKVALTNAIAFSRDGEAMYFSDSETRRIQRYDYDRASGALGERRLFASIADDAGFADGSCVDAEDCLWNARYYAGFVQRYRPDGSEDLRVRVPTDCVTCICFGGDDLRTLFISTGCKDLGADQLAAQPHAGGLFVARVPATGLSESRFGKLLF